MLGVAKLAPGPGNVALAERPEPSARPGRVVLEVTATGICGTDLHIVDDEFPSRPPVTLGHEISGVVASLGEGVDEACSSASGLRSTCARITAVEGTPKAASCSTIRRPIVP